MGDEVAALRRHVADLEWRLRDVVALGADGNPRQLMRLRDDAVLWLAGLHAGLLPTKRAQKVAEEIGSYKRCGWQSDRTADLVPSAVSPKRWQLYCALRYTEGRGLQYRKIMDILEYSFEVSKS